jgi:glutathionyl-hydroquinone reductase
MVKQSVFIVLKSIYLSSLKYIRKFSTPEECPGAIPDNINHAQHIRDVYFKVNPDYTGRFTVPLLWDKKLNTIGKCMIKGGDGERKTQFFFV